MPMSDRARLVEAHLGFRIVRVEGSKVKGAEGPDTAQYQRIDEKGKVLHVAPAVERELTMFNLLCTPERDWS